MEIMTFWRNSENFYFSCLFCGLRLVELLHSKAIIKSIATINNESSQYLLNTDHCLAILLAPCRLSL